MTKARSTLATRIQRQAPALPALALVVAVSLCVTFTSLNVPLARDAARQSVLASAFCIIAACTYLLYMIVSRAAACVLSYVEHGYDEVPDADDEEGLLWQPHGGSKALGDSPLLHLVAGGRSIAAVHREAAARAAQQRVERRPRRAAAHVAARRRRGRR